MGTTRWEGDACPGTGRWDGCNEAPCWGSSELHEMLRRVRLGELSEQPALCTISSSAQKASVQVLFGGKMSVSIHPSISFIVYTSAGSRVKRHIFQTALLSCHLKIFQYVSLRTLMLLLQHFCYLRNWFLWHRNCQSLMWYKINLTSDWNHISVKNKLTQPITTHKSNFKQRALLTIILIIVSH